jgi:glucose-6-phosphate isomerase
MWIIFWIALFCKPVVAVLQLRRYVAKIFFICITKVSRFMPTRFPQLTNFDIHQGVIPDAPLLERRLSDLAGYFADATAYAQAQTAGNPLLYTVSNVEPAQGEGALHYGITNLLPGQVGREYYMTKGHYHAWRPAAEYYIGLAGQGLILLEDEQSGVCWSMPLVAQGAVYIPGNAAHRTINIGREPLTFLGIYPANAGHDYAAIREHNFRHVVVELNGQPTVIERTRYLGL